MYKKYARYDDLWKYFINFGNIKMKMNRARLLNSKFNFMYFNDIWKEKNTGKLIEFVYHSCDMYLFFNVQLINQMKYEVLPISFVNSKEVIIHQSETFGKNAIVQIIDENSFTVGLETYERSIDTHGVLNRHVSQGWEKIMQVAFNKKIAKI